MLELLILVAQNYTFWLAAIGIIFLPKARNMKFLLDPKRIRYAALFAILDKIVVIAEIWAMTMGFSHRWLILTSVIGYMCRSFMMAGIGLAIANLGKYQKYVITPAVLNSLLVSTAFFTDIVFTHTPDLEFRRGPLGYSTHITAVIYFVYCLFWVGRYYSRGERRKDKLCVLLFAFSGLIAAGIDTLKLSRSTLDGTVVVACILVFLYVYVQYTNRDPLTQLLNRQAYYEYIESNAEKITGVISIDMNGLKQINDSLGHAAGDEALAKIGRVLCDNENPFVRPYRMAGDEFTVLCIKYNNKEILETVEILKNKLAENENNCSVGYAVRDGAKSLDVLNHEADVSMYLAKRQYYEKHDRRKR